MDRSQALIVATGPEGSGTRWLARLMREHLGLEVEHRPMPNHDVWWRWHDDPAGTRYVIIQRRPDVTQLSLLSQHARWEGEPVRPLRADWQQARDWWRAAVYELARIPGATWLSYEALVMDTGTQMFSLARTLGVKPQGELPETIDGNAKWLSYLER